MKKCNLMFLFVFNAVFVYSQTIRYVNQSATGSNNGTSWANAYTNLQTAISNCAVGDTLWVAKGTYTPHASDITESFKINGLTLVGGFAGTETSIVQRDVLGNKTTLSGDLLGNLTSLSQHVVLIQATGKASKLDGFYISRGYAEGAVGDPRLGGGVKLSGNTGTALTLSNCVFEYNTAANGGAVYVYSESAPHTVNIENCIFYNNYCDICGASVYLYSSSSITVRNCTFVTTNGANDLGIMYGGSNFNGYNSVFKSNTGKHLKSYYWGKINFSNCLFSGDPSADSVRIFTNNKVSTDPLLASDYTLQSGSPAIDAGSNSFSTLATDISGKQRVINNVVDMGALESSLASGIANWQVIPAPLQLYPNPVSSNAWVTIPIGQSIRSISLTDCNGSRRIPGYSRADNILKIDISGYAPGVYFLIIQTDQGSYGGKLVKQ